MSEAFAQPEGAMATAENTATFVKSTRNRSNLRKKTTDEGEQNRTNTPSMIQTEPDRTTDSATENPSAAPHDPTDAAAAHADVVRIAHASALRKRANPMQMKASDFKQKTLDINLFFNSNKSAVPHGSQDQFATAVNEMDTAPENDAVAIQKKKEDIQKERQQLIKEGKIQADDNVYRGMNYYDTYLPQGDTSGRIKGVGILAGPIRASAAIRVTSRFDYQPDICKDYKETGYCGFGDACKFLHDRGDYKTGWQLEKEWEEEQKAKRERVMSHLDDENPDEQNGNGEKEDDYNLPFACLMCHEHFSITKNPVVTKCGHYFDYACARKMLKKSGRCHTCGQQTQGIINTAYDIIKRLKQTQHDGVDIE